MGVIASWAEAGGRGEVFRFALCLRRRTKALRTTMASNEMKAKSSHAAKMLSKEKRRKKMRGESSHGLGVKGQATINIETVIALAKSFHAFCCSPSIAAMPVTVTASPETEIAAVLTSCPRSKSKSESESENADSF